MKLRVQTNLQTKLLEQDLSSYPESVIGHYVEYFTALSSLSFSFFFIWFLDIPSFCLVAVISLI